MIRSVCLNVHVHSFVLFCLRHVNCQKNVDIIRDNGRKNESANVPDVGSTDCRGASMNADRLGRVKSSTREADVQVELDGAA